MTTSGPRAIACAATGDLDCLGGQSAAKQQNETRYEQAHTMRARHDHRRSRGGRALRQKVAHTPVSHGSQACPTRICIPSRTLMLTVLGAPMRFGGFDVAACPWEACYSTIESTSTFWWLTCPSGIPYAICDLYCPAAGVDNEYNGIGHELQNASHPRWQRNNGPFKAMGIHVLVINRDSNERPVAFLKPSAQTMHRLAGVRFRYRIKGYRKRQAAWLSQRSLRAGIGLAPV